MQGDITRLTFTPQKHYRNVRMQQGRVQMDADWNEQADIQAHQDHTARTDIIGACGAPQGNAGFGLTPAAGNIQIGAGRYYVDGILLENETQLLMTAQPDLPGFTLPTQTGIYLAYLDVWFRHISALEDPAIREVALGGPDTATRAKTIQQVRLTRVATPGANVNCTSNFPGWNSEIAAGTGKMSARSQPQPDAPDPCVIPASAGFRRLENQLYRVEVHAEGPVGIATFKWSRENGSVVAQVESVVADEITVSTVGRDVYLGFAPGQWIEVTDNVRELNGQHGTLVQITALQDRTLTVDLATAIGPLTPADFPLTAGPKVRRWESAGAPTVTTPGTNDGFLPLEDGVEVRFEAGTYNTGDYWLVPARTLVGDVEWPQGSTGPLPQLPQGVQHHYCRLALLERTAGGWVLREDCRNLFPPLTQLTELLYISGDGQDVVQDPTQPATLQALPQALQVGVINGQAPVAGAVVRFTVTEGAGRLQGSGATVNVVTGADGIASCAWEVDTTNLVQEVEARLLDHGGNPIDLPVRFSAGLLRITSLFYLSGDSQEAKLDPTDPTKLLPLEPLIVGVTRGVVPVAGAQVVFQVMGGGTGRVDGVAVVTKSTGADGVAICTWTLDPTMAVQHVVASLRASGGGAIHVPITFTATLPRTAAQVPYAPGACEDLAQARTVQEALDILCTVGGRQDPGIAVRAVRTSNAAGAQIALVNDADLPADRLARGIRVITDRPVDPALVKPPVFFITLELPYPLSAADRNLWSFDQLVGFQPLVLDGDVVAENEIMAWRPTQTTSAWLLTRLFQKLQELKAPDRILGRLTLKGNFIADEKDGLYLDGDIYGAPGSGGRTELKFPSGNGIRGGDFEMWFWLRPPTPAGTGPVVVDPGRDVVTPVTPITPVGPLVNPVVINPADVVINPVVRPG